MSSLLPEDPSHPAHENNIDSEKQTISEYKYPGQKKRKLNTFKNDLKLAEKQLNTCEV